MRSFVRVLAFFSVCAFVVLTLRALPDRAECDAPDVHFQHGWIVALHAVFALAAIVAALAFSRRHAAIALAFIVVAHVSASRGLERVEVGSDGGDGHRAFHRHGPWALMRTHAGEGTAAREHPLRALK